MPLRQRQAQQALTIAARFTRSNPASRPANSVSYSDRRYADLRQARQILVGGVKHPHVGGQHLGDRRQRLTGSRRR